MSKTRLEMSLRAMLPSSRATKRQRLHTNQRLFMSWRQTHDIFCFGVYLEMKMKETLSDWSRTDSHPNIQETPEAF